MQLCRGSIGVIDASGLETLGEIAADLHLSIEGWT